MKIPEPAGEDFFTMMERRRREGEAAEKGATEPDAVDADEPFIARLERRKREAAEAMRAETFLQTANRRKREAAEAARTPRLAANGQYAVVPDGDARAAAWVRAALAAKVADLAATPEGSRNSTLNATAYAIGRFVPRWVSEDEVEAALDDAGRACGLRSDEVRRSLRSGLSAGMLAPRDPPISADPIDGPFTPCAADANVTAFDPATGEVLDRPAPVAATGSDKPVQRTRVPIAERVLSRAMLGSLPQPEPLIDDTLDQRTVALLAGRRSSGKSFLALDWSCCIATGKAWQGRQVADPGPVLYVAAEGAYGLHRRVSAWEYAWQTTADDLDVLPEPVNLFTGSGFADLLDHVAARRYRLVVVDTWARSTVGGRENDNTDSTIAFERVDRLRHIDGGAAVLVVAHTDKGDTTVRGASALEDNADTVYRIKGDPRLLELTREKRKDGPTDDLHRLQLTAVLDSCVVQSSSGHDRALSGNAEALMSAFAEHFADMGASKAELRAIANRAPATFQRSLKALVSTGALVNHGPDTRPFYKPGPAHG